MPHDPEFEMPKEPRPPRKRAPVVPLLIVACVGALAFGYVHLLPRHKYVAPIVASGSTLPATCDPHKGQVFEKTGGNAGLYACVETNTWYSPLTTNPPMQDGVHPTATGSALRFAATEGDSITGSAATAKTWSTGTVKGGTGGAVTMTAGSGGVSPATSAGTIYTNPNGKILAYREAHTPAQVKTIMKQMGPSATAYRFRTGKELPKTCSEPDVFLVTVNDPAGTASTLARCTPNHKWEILRSEFSPARIAE